ncbi:AraC family transcriptional regulator [Paenibacillus sp. D2_2]|uniref:helix-turn-helix domain-containing protein n=1 Tax=Paenibacillus sp. D2_2 TaxID=3073092 RepID=UPI0028165BD1|nr:AraC family transcriptional regulator [Paenibacillus sp. D2_2]WMT41912.1 AraC family transcriptional regulator [Paenibacillus sp. D2_2]
MAMLVSYEQRIRKAITEKEIAEAMAMIHELFATIKERRPAGRHEILDLCVNLYYLIQSHLKEESTGGKSAGVQELMSAERVERLHQLLIEELEQISQSQAEDATASNYKIKRVLDYIHQHYDHDLTLDELASYVGLNNSYLSRIFKEQTGSMLVPYINRYRVKKSLELLKDGKLKTYEIAEKVGFNSTDNYYISFKKMYGLPPNEYRKNYMGK